MKSFAIPLLVLFETTLLLAQPSISWQSVQGDMFDDVFNDILVLAEGDIYALGTIHSTASTPGAKGQNDVFLVKYSPTGAFIWNKKFGGTRNDEGHSLVQMSNGDIAIVATSESSDGDVGSNNGNLDVWVFSVDSSGALQWETNIGGTGDDRGKRVMPTASGLAVAYEKGAPERDFAISFISNSGTVQSSHYYGSSCIDKITDGIALADGTFVLAGTVECADGNVSSVYGNEDVWLLRLDANGQVLWEKTYGGTGRDYPAGMVQGSDGRIYVSAESIFSDHDVPPLKGGYDLWFFAVDTANGSLKWSKTYGTTGNDYSGRIAVYNHELYSAGTAGSSGGDLTGTSTGSQDLWVLKLDTAGNLIWEANFGSSLNDKGLGVAVTADHILAAGFAGAADGDVPQHFGTSDGWLLDLGTPLGLRDMSNSQFSVYPNPFQSNLNLEVWGEGFTALVCTANGKQVFQQQFPQATGTLSLEPLPPGLYFLELKNEKGRAVIKIIKNGA